SVYQLSGSPAEPVFPGNGSLSGESSSSVITTTTNKAPERTKPSLQAPGFVSGADNALPRASIGFSSPSPPAPGRAAHGNATSMSSSWVMKLLPFAYGPQAVLLESWPPVRTTKPPSCRQAIVLGW